MSAAFPNPIAKTDKYGAENKPPKGSRQYESKEDENTQHDYETADILESSGRRRWTSFFKHKNTPCVHYTQEVCN